jgi:hypothetical protein
VPSIVPAWAHSLAFVQPVRRGEQDCVRARSFASQASTTVVCFGRIGWQGLGARLVLRDDVGFVVGRLGGGIARLVVQYTDGDRSSVLRGRRAYQVPLPAWRWRGPHRPVAVVAYDPSGKVVARRSIPPA